MFQNLAKLAPSNLSKSVPTLVQLRLNFPIRVVSAHCGLFWGICGRCGGPDVSAIVINCELLTHMTFVVAVVRIYHKATVKTQDNNMSIAEKYKSFQKL